MGSSSSDEDGDENWRAAVNSVAVDSSAIFRNGSNQNGTGHSKLSGIDGGKEGKSSNLKSCQARAQDLLHRYLDKTLTIIASPESRSHVCKSTIDDAEDEIRLFRRAPRGITVKPVAETPETLIPRKKPRIPPRKDIDEKSVEFQSQIQSVAVDGAIIIAKAEKEKTRALVRMQEKEAAAQAAVKKEEERVALLKQQRGEKWLPSIASEMFGNTIAKIKKL
jgi:hypothetical protein